MIKKKPQILNFFYGSRIAPRYALLFPKFGAPLLLPGNQNLKGEIRVGGGGGGGRKKFPLEGWAWGGARRWPRSDGPVCAKNPGKARGRVGETARKMCCKGGGWPAGGVSGPPRSGRGEEGRGEGGGGPGRALDSRLEQGWVAVGGGGGGKVRALRRETQGKAGGKIRVKCLGNKANRVKFE